MRRLIDFKKERGMKVFEQQEGYENKQHNIMCLVGNGFDIAALKWLNNNATNLSRDSGFGPNVSSSYVDFFNYLSFARDKELAENPLYSKMKEYHREFTKAKDAGDKEKEEQLKNWSDFEGIVNELMQGVDQEDEDKAQKLHMDLLSMQREFSIFLNKLLPADKIVEFDRLVSEKRFAKLSLEAFLADIKADDPQKDKTWNMEKNPPNLPFQVDYGHLLNFAFVVFNYTKLLDSYIYLDSGQFVPNKNAAVDENFTFFQNPGGLFKTNPKLDNKRIVTHYPGGNEVDQNDKGTSSAVRVLTHVVHPHGIQDVPRSILFGTERDGIGDKDQRKLFIKNKWARDKERYSKDISRAELFVIFGMALSGVDGWWMSEIYKCLSGIGMKRRKKADIPELFIYNFTTDSKNDVPMDKIKQRFLDACIYISRDEKKKYDSAVKKRIYVINYRAGENIFLGFPEKDIEVVETEAKNRNYVNSKPGQ